MNPRGTPIRSHQLWARFRFSVVGSLLAAPPEKGALQAAFAALAEKTWAQPLTGAPVRFSAKTIERWYYRAARENNDPVAALANRLRSDLGGHTSLSAAHQAFLAAQYQQHGSWSYQLHYDNLLAACREDPAAQKPPSYATVMRFMKSQGLFKRKKKRHKFTQKSERPEGAFEARETRSYEAVHNHLLWHTDFHLGSRKVLLREGVWHVTKLLAVMDDRSRLCCHLQWYLGETAEHLIHGLCQAFLKRGLPRELLSDNGSAMIAHETTEGLERLGVLHHRTLPESPHQNGKQECFFGQVEGRLLAMLESVKDLTLELLNQATQAWVELEYNQKNHSELGMSPVERLRRETDVSRRSPSWQELVQLFTTEQSRSQRRGDGSVSIEGKRFEIPSRYRHLQRVTLRFASWDLTRVWLTDPRTGMVLTPIYPWDREKNSDGLRRNLTPIQPATQLPPAPVTTEPAPLLKQLMAAYAATGLPPAYLKKTEGDE